MRPLTQRVPQLQRLAVFDAVVTAGSFTGAARDLGISQPAVSRHMAALADELDVALFDRSGRSIALTSAGQTLAGAVSSSFASLERALVDVVDERAAFVMAVQPAMATSWVVPMLEILERAIGGDIRLQIFDRRSELDATGWNIAIAPGDGRWPEWESEMLFHEAVQPLAAPSLASELGFDIETPAGALASANLLHIDDIERPSMTWQQWFVEAGTDVNLPPPRLVYNAYPTVLQEAIAGNGVVLGWQYLLTELVERGLLVPVGPVVERPHSGHHICWRSGQADERHRVLRNTLIEAMADHRGW